MRRLLALLVAVGLVVVALVIRNSGDDSGKDGRRLRLTCAPELAQVCDAFRSDVDVTVEAPGTTADRLAKGDKADLDGWLTPGPWPEIVRQARLRTGKSTLLSQGAPLAQTRVGLAVWPDRAAVLGRACPKAEISWHCVGDVAGKGQWTAVGGQAVWGPIKIGLPDPSSEATGLAALGAATADYFGHSNLTSTDLDDDGFRSWLRGLAGVTSNVPLLDTALAAGPSVADAVVTLEAVGTPLIKATARSPKPALLYPSNVADADVVLGRVGGDRGRRLADLVGEKGPTALVAAGWQPANGRPSGLPPAGLLDALRTAWREAAG